MAGDGFNTSLWEIGCIKLGTKTKANLRGPTRRVQGGRALCHREQTFRGIGTASPSSITTPTAATYSTTPTPMNTIASVTTAAMTIAVTVTKPPRLCHLSGEWGGSDTSPRVFVSIHPIHRNAERIRNRGAGRVKQRTWEYEARAPLTVASVPSGAFLAGAPPPPSLLLRWVWGPPGSCPGSHPGGWGSSVVRRAPVPSSSTRCHSGLASGTWASPLPLRLVCSLQTPESREAAGSAGAQQQSTLG